MRLLIDPHCHIYANYDLRKSLYFAEQQKADAIAIILTERHDCNYFDRLATQSTNNLEFKIQLVDANCLKVNQKLFIFRGRQFATSEGLEVLSLFVAPKLDDKLAAQVYCDQIISDGGVIAFSWAFGKVMGKRGQIVNQLANRYGINNVLLLDSRIRPSMLALPKFFEDLRKNSFSILSGSDPLPIKSHQNKLASFCAIFDISDIDLNGINTGYIKNLLLNNRNHTQYGKRSGFIEFIIDQLKLRF